MQPTATNAPPILPSQEPLLLLVPETPAEYLQAYPTTPEPDRNQPSEALMAAAVLRLTADRMTIEKTWIQGTSVRDITPRWQVLLAKSLPGSLRHLLPERRIGRCSVAGIFGNACDSSIVPGNITPGAITLAATDAMSRYLREHALNSAGDIVAYNDAAGRTLQEITDVMHGAARELEAQAAQRRHVP